MKTTITERPLPTGEGFTIESPLPGGNGVGESPFVFFVDRGGWVLTSTY